MNKPRIGLVSNPGLSPNERAVLRNLGRMVRDEFDLHLLCGQNADGRDLEDSYRLHQGRGFGTDPAKFRYAFNLCAAYAGKLNLDLLMNVTSPATIGFAVTVFAGKFGIRSLVRMTGDSFGEARLHRHPWQRMKAWLLHDRIATLAYKRADHILAVGQRLKSELVRRHFDPAGISVLPQPFDRSLFTPLDTAGKMRRKTELGLKADRTVILFTGRLSWLKGADRIVKIIRAVGDRSRAFQFCLVGRGEYDRAFEPFPPELVCRPGLVSHREIFRYFQAADLLIFPSRTEGLPNAILEALACNVPVIAAPVGEIADRVSNLATEPEDYVEYILKGNYIPDELPDTLDFDYLRKEYINLFQTVIRL